jgi:hypothetical protein
MQKHFEERSNLLGYIQNERRSLKFRRGCSCANVRVMADCETVEEEEEEEEEEEGGGRGGGGGEEGVSAANERSNIISYSEAETVLTKCSE